MMKTLADVLGTYRQNVERFRGTPLHRHEAVGLSQDLSNDVLLFTAKERRIRIALANLVEETRTFTGGRNLTNLAMRPADEDERLFLALLDRLEELRDVLRTARPNAEAALLGQTVDDTQVPDPF